MSDPKDDLILELAVASSMVSEKISALLTEDYLKSRDRKAKKKDFKSILDRVPNREPLPGDEL